MSTYRPHGLPHHILGVLEDGDADFLHLVAATKDAGTFSRKRRRKLWHYIGSLLADEVIGGTRACYYLRPPGREALNVLRSGYPFTVTPQPRGVRHFEEAST